jgi:hypothetical protein
MDLEENEARNDCADEDQQQIERSTDRPTLELVLRQVVCRQSSVITS